MLWDFHLLIKSYDLVMQIHNRLRALCQITCHEKFVEKMMLG